MFSWSGFPYMYDLEGLEESTLEGYFDVSFVRASYLDYSAQYHWGFLLFLPGYFFHPLVWQGSGGLLLVPFFIVMIGVPEFSNRTDCDCN